VFETGLFASGVLFGIFLMMLFDRWERRHFENESDKSFRRLNVRRKI